MISSRLQSVRWLLAELVVVVFGILIAFQADEWNDNRQLHAEERNALIAMRDELILISQFNEQLINRSRSQLDSANEFVNFLYTDNADSPEEYARLWFQVQGVAEFDISSPTYEGLRENNRLSIIQNSELANLLRRYFEVAAPQIRQSQERLIDLRNEFYMVSSPDAFMTTFEELKQDSNLSIVPMGGGPRGARLAVRYPVTDAPRDGEFLPALSRFTFRKMAYVNSLEFSQGIITDLLARMDDQLD